MIRSGKCGQDQSNPVLPLTPAMFFPFKTSSCFACVGESRERKKIANESSHALGHILPNFSSKQDEGVVPTWTLVSPTCAGTLALPSAICVTLQNPQPLWGSVASSVKWASNGTHVTGRSGGPCRQEQGTGMGLMHDNCSVSGRLMLWPLSLLLGYG